MKKSIINFFLKIYTFLKYLIFIKKKKLNEFTEIYKNNLLSLNLFFIFFYLIFFLLTFSKKSNIR